MVNDSIGVKLRLLVRIELIMKYICSYIGRIEK